MKPRTFEEAVRLYDRLIKAQMRKLAIYRDYEEYYQCGLIALWRAYEQFEEEKGSFPAYALYTVRGYLLVQLEREQRFATRHVCWRPLMTDMLPTVEREDYFLEYMHGLTEEQQYVLKERFVSGRKLKDIADTLGMTYDRARYVYRSALAKVAEKEREA